MGAKAKAGTAGSQQPGALSGSPGVWGSGPWPSAADCLGRLVEAKLEMGQQGCEPACEWDAGIAGGGLLCCTTMTAPIFSV